MHKHASHTSKQQTICKIFSKIKSSSTLRQRNKRFSLLILATLPIEKLDLLLPGYLVTKGDTTCYSI